MIYGFNSLNDIRRIDRTVSAHELTSPPKTGDRPQYPLLNFYPRIGFYNDSGSTIPPFGCVLLKGSQAQKTTTTGPGVQVVAGPVQGICPSVKQPDRFGCQSDVFIADEALGTGYLNQAFGAAQQVPPFVALYDSADGTPATGERWGPRSGTFKLKKNTGGFLVIGPYDTTNHYALVLPESMTTVRGKIASDCAPGASADLTIWTGAIGAEATTSLAITSVYNDSDCTIRATPKFATAIFVPLNSAWLFVVGRTA
jgi:hypothetical protein